MDPERAHAFAGYRHAFEEFSRKARCVQSLTDHPHPDRAAIDRALLELEQARVKYNNARDALVRQLLPASPRETIPVVISESSQARREHVRDIAELLWEGAGRPEGTAEEDWRRAEEIVRRATAPAA